MDRPEDVEISPITGAVYVMLTNNSKRKPDQVTSCNPRANNEHGHVLELLPPGQDHARQHGAKEFGWNVLLRCGDPRQPEQQAHYHAAVTTDGWLSSPDNAAFDSQGRLWIATDSRHDVTGFTDGIYACDTTGPGRGLTRLFCAGPRGAELSGVSLTPDDRTIFVAVQHPAEEPGSTYSHPSTRWPDFSPKLPPRPAVVAIFRPDGQTIGR